MTPRTIRRWLLRRRAWREAAPLLEKDYRIVAEHLFGAPVTWQRAGGAGRSVVCRVLRQGAPVACFRLARVLHEAADAKDRAQPFIQLSPEGTIAREWDAYTRGTTHGLTPRPIWCDQRAIFSEYIDARPLASETRSRVALAAEALPAIARLHHASVAHMDMSLANILRDAQRGSLLFVDFEYGPAPGLSFEQQCLYDYLRLFESTWKFLSPAERREAGPVWSQTVASHVPAAVRTAESLPLKPALGRILAAPELDALWRMLVSPKIPAP